MALDRKKLENWVKRQLLMSSEENPVCRITLRHAMGGNKAATVKDMEVSPHDSALDITTQLHEAANDDAEGLGGLQSYVIASYFMAVPDKVRERLSFRLAVETDGDDEINQTEAPTERGLTQQLMRHNEANARVMTMGMGEVVRQQNRMIERQATMIENFMDKHMGLLELQEKMMTASDQRDIAKMQVVSKISREDAALEKFMELAPIVVNRFMGQKMLKEDATPTEMMLADFAKSLTPQQMEVMMKTLTPEQSLKMIEFISLQQKRDEEKEKKRLAAKNPPKQE